MFFGRCCGGMNGWSVRSKRWENPPWNEHTVDGSEIRRSPVEVGSLSHYLQGFYIPGGCLEFLNHQQELLKIDGRSGFLLGAFFQVPCVSERWLTVTRIKWVVVQIKSLFWGRFIWIYLSGKICLCDFWPQIGLGYAEFDNILTLLGIPEYHLIDLKCNGCEAISYVQPV